MPRPIAVCLASGPEVVRLAPVVHELRRRGVPAVPVTVGRRRAALDRALATFEIEPGVDLRTASAGRALGAELGRLRPAAVVVQADTATASSAAPAAFSRGLPVAEVEAGRRAPRPVAADLASWHFAPTETARRNLLGQGVAPAGIHVTAGTVADAARWVAARRGLLHRPRTAGPRRVLVAVRGDGRGGARRGLGPMLARLAERADVELAVAPPRAPGLRASVLAALAAHGNVTALDRVGFERVVAELAAAHLVLTDSAAVQEAAPALDVPVLVLGDMAARPEGVAAGCAALCGADPARALQRAERLLDDEALHRAMAAAPSPYGDGRAAERIVARLTGDLVPDVHSGLLAA